MRTLVLLGIILTAAATPLYVIRWRVGFLPVTLLEVITIVTSLCWLIWRWRLGWHGAWGIVRQHPWPIFWAALLLLAGAAGIFVSDDIRAALGIYKAYFVEPAILAAIIVDVIRNRQEQWRWVALGLCAAGAVVAAVSMLQWLTGWPNIAPAELTQGRVSSLFNSANAVGLFSVPLVFVALGMFLQKKTKGVTRFLLLCLAAILLAAIVLSRSDGAIIGLTGAGLIFASVISLQWIRLPIPRPRWIVIAVLIGIYALGSIGYVWFVNEPPTVANPYARPGFSTLTIRQCVWQGTKSLLSERPIAGGGLANFPESYLPYSTCDAEPLMYPHMLILNFWTETGALGVLAICGFIGWWVWASWSLCRQRDYWLAGTFAAIMAYWLLHGLVDVPYFKNDLSMEWWILSALLALAVYRSGAAEADAWDDASA